MKEVATLARAEEKREEVRNIKSTRQQTMVAVGLWDVQILDMQKDKVANNWDGENYKRSRKRGVGDGSRNSVMDTLTFKMPIRTYNGKESEK